MSNKIENTFDRRNLTFNTSKVVDVLPEYFQSENPQLIQLLNAYYEFMDSDDNVNDKLSNLLKARDIGSVSLDFLDFLLTETGLGIRSSQVLDPITIARNFPDYFRYKGSLFSAKYFFRMLYNEEVTIQYPKDQLFIVGESKIGPESLKLIQNGKLYQILSILIKSSQPISEWRTAFKKFVHPAGFYLGGEVLSESSVDLSLDSMPNIIFDSEQPSLLVSSLSEINIQAPFVEPTAIIDSDTISLNRILSNYDSNALDTLDNIYPNILKLSDVNSITFSDSSTIDLSVNIETMDRDRYKGFNDTVWILATGEWADDGVWVDAAVWIDSL
jgi:hypothetical protein